MRVIVIGGYGSFGRRITSRILKIPGIKVIICGRNAFKAKELFPSCQYSKLDIFEPNLEMKIKELKGDLLIHTAGPFDECEGYRVAKACIAASCNYIDLSDNRQYVNGMHHLLDSSAKAAGCTVISGASTTPGLTSSVIHSFALHNQLSSVDIRISAANSSMPGEATVKSILSYCGKPIKIVVNKKDVYITAWQYPSLSTIPGLSERRLCSDVDIPDSDSDYTRDLENFRFRAGVENRFSMLGLAALALARRFNFISSQLLCNQSKFLLELNKALRNRWIKSESSTDGGMVMTMQGRAQHDNNITATVTWGIVASESAGPEIPCTPAVILTRKFAEIHATKTHKHASLSPGASACTGHFNLKEFMEELTEDEWTREHVNEYVQYQYCRTGHGVHPSPVQGVESPQDIKSLPSHETSSCRFSYPVPLTAVTRGNSPAAILPFPLPSPCIATLDRESQRLLPPAIAHVHGAGGTVVGTLNVTMLEIPLFPLRLLCGLVGLPLPTPSHKHAPLHDIDRTKNVDIGSGSSPMGTGDMRSGAAANDGGSVDAVATSVLESNDNVVEELRRSKQGSWLPPLTREVHQSFSVIVRMQPNQWSRWFAPLSRSRLPEPELPQSTGADSPTCRDKVSVAGNTPGARHTDPTSARVKNSDSRAYPTPTPTPIRTPTSTSTSTSTSIFIPTPIRTLTPTRTSTTTTSVSHFSTFLFHSNYFGVRDRHFLGEGVLGGLVSFLYQQRLVSPLALSEDDDAAGLAAAASGPDTENETSRGATATSRRNYSGFEGVCRGLQVGGIPFPLLPILPVPHSTTRPHADGLGWDVDVTLSLPFLRTPLVRYRGPLRVVATATAAAAGAAGAAGGGRVLSSTATTSLSPSVTHVGAIDTNGSKKDIDRVLQSIHAQGMTLDPQQQNIIQGVVEAYGTRTKLTAVASDSATSNREMTLESTTNRSSNYDHIDSTVWARVLGKHLLVFDGVCVMCDGIVGVLLDEDHSGQLIVSPSNHPTARLLLEVEGRLPRTVFDEKKGHTIIVMDPFGQVYCDSAAAIEVLRALGGKYAVLGAILAALPVGLRDSVYRFVGKHRYSVFGKKDQCGMPSPSNKVRYL